MRVSLIGLALLSFIHLDSRAADPTEPNTVPPPRIFYVTNYGVDSPTCGSLQNPCRSISSALSQTIFAREEIRVGPGRYGDINGDGDFSDPGDEQGGRGPCVLCMLSSVNVYSTDGAAMTLIDARGTTSPQAVLFESVSTAEFGARGRGFTILTDSLYGVYVEDDSTDFAIAGNVVSGATQSAYRLTNRNIVASHNVAIDNLGQGFTVAPNGFNVPNERTVLRANASIRNGLGFGILGRDVDLIGNVADGNGQGALVEGVGLVIRGNTISNNGSDGVFIAPDSLLPGVAVTSFSGNTIVGNRGAGVTIARHAKVNPLLSNNIYGNGTSEVPLTGEPKPNCGLVNASGKTIKAKLNFWGSPSGPGPDPADEVCNILGSVTVVEPVAPSPR